MVSGFSKINKILNKIINKREVYSSVDKVGTMGKNINKFKNNK